jgi:hypothetical protein
VVCESDVLSRWYRYDIGEVCSRGKIVRGFGRGWHEKKLTPATVR